MSFVEGPRTVLPEDPKVDGLATRIGGLDLLVQQHRTQTPVLPLWQNLEFDDVNALLIFTDADRTDVDPVVLHDAERELRDLRLEELALNRVVPAAELPDYYIATSPAVQVAKERDVRDGGSP